MASRVKQKIAFVVDGKSERALDTKLDRTNHDFFFVKRDKNGRDVTIKAMAEECHTILKVISNLYHKVIIIVDREERPRFSAACIENEMKKIICKEKLLNFDIIVADQMFENWILSDIYHVSECNLDLLSPTANNISHEGINGSGKLDNIWITSKSKKKYSSDKVSHSKKLFKYVRPMEGRNFSVSFSKFLDVLQRHGIILH